MRINAQESTALREVVKCENGHTVEVWFIRSPEGIIVESQHQPHRFLPKNREDESYTSGSCCFRASCDRAWELRLHV
ncbi:MAG: hypothetical protein V2B18_17975 [Pseudomonadota bacterium]